MTEHRAGAKDRRSAAADAAAADPSVDIRAVVEAAKAQLEAMAVANMEAAEARGEDNGSDVAAGAAAADHIDDELASFTRNIDALEAIIRDMEDEVASRPPHLDQWISDHAKFQSLLEELRHQQARAVLARGETDKSVRRLKNLLLVRLPKVSNRAIDILRQSDADIGDPPPEQEAHDPLPPPRPAVDNAGAPREDAPMNDLTRQEVDAKLAASEAKVDARLANFDLSIKTGFAELASALQKQSSDLSAAMERQSGELRVEMAQMRAEMAKQSGEMRTEMAKQSGEMRTEMANVRGDSHKSTTEITRWVVGFGIAILGAIFTLSKVSEKPAAGSSQSSAQQQSPIVIAVPAGSVLLKSSPQAPANPSGSSAK